MTAVQEFTEVFRAERRRVRDLLLELTAENPPGDAAGCVLVLLPARAFPYPADLAALGLPPTT